MSGNTHEYLVLARSAVESALIEESEGIGASEAILAHIDRAMQELNRAVLVQRAILSHLSGADFLAAPEEPT